MALPDFSPTLPPLVVVVVVVFVLFIFDCLRKVIKCAKWSELYDERIGLRCTEVISYRLVDITLQPAFEYISSGRRTARGYFLAYVKI